MKKIMKGKKSNILAIAMCLLMVSGIFLHTMAPKAADVDEKYQSIFESYENSLWGKPMTASEVLEKYGAMNYDYYRIVLEETLLYQEGNKDIQPKSLTMISSVLQKDGFLSLETRKSLREDVETYGLDKDLIPYDPDFHAGTANTVKPSGSGGNYVVKNEEDEAFKKAWEEKHGIESSDPVETTVPTPTPTPKPVIDTGFADVDPDAWYAEAIAAMNQSGLIKGYDDGLFHPNDQLTAGQWCTIVWRIVGGNICPPEGTVTQGGTNVVAKHWAAVALNMCQSYGYTELSPTFYPENRGGTFFEDELTNRGEAVTAVVKIVEDTNLTSTLVSKAEDKGIHGWTLADIPDGNVIEQNVEPRYVDSAGKPYYNETHWWNPDSIVKAYNYGILQGVDSLGTCNPHGILTRAEACQMLYNAMITSPRPIKGHGGIM